MPAAKSSRRIGRFHRAHPEVVLDIVVDDAPSDIAAAASMPVSASAVDWRRT